MTVAVHLSLKQKLILCCYSLLWMLIVPFTFCHFALQFLRRKSGYSLLRLSRYGMLSKTSITTDGTLIHCASVGEVVAIQGLVESLLNSKPEHPITISTATTTGAERVKLLFANRVNHVYLPYDFPLFMRVFINKLQPKKVLINEMELWPNLCHTCYRNNIPLYIVNGRMSDKSAKTYQKFPSLFSPMFSRITGICAQGQRDYDNYLELGINPKKLTLTNNIKFDLNMSEADLNMAATIESTFDINDRAILVAGSTHEPEEQILLDAYLSLQKDFPTLLLIMVPRHPQRFEKVHQLLKKQNIKINLMSTSQACSETTQVLLCDKMGQLRSIYALADIAFVGGSFAQRGGHNALEPAAVGVPIIMGPSRYNNPAICLALETANALRNVAHAEDIVSVCQHWLKHPEIKATDGQAGKQVLQQNGGAINKTLEVIASAATT